MARLLAILLGTLGLLLAIYLVALLYLVRKRGYGEGRRVEVPRAGLAFRCPGWWCEVVVRHKIEGDSGTPYASFETGIQRGLLTVGASPLEDQPAPPEAARTTASPTDPPDTLASELEAILLDRGFVLDEVQIVTGVAGPGHSPSGARAWIASNGRESAQAESRSYFELHLVEIDGHQALFTYTNSVLHGFLDAFYIERVLSTIERLGGPPAR